MRRAFVAFAALSLISACAESAPAPEPAGWTDGPITDEATFRREIAGRTLTLSNDRVASTVTIGDDGAFGAVTTSADGETLLSRLEGTWSFENGQFCRQFEVVEGETRAPLSECASVSKSSGVMTVFPPGRPATDWIVTDA